MIKETREVRNRPKEHSKDLQSGGLLQPQLRGERGFSECATTPNQARGRGGKG